MTEQRKSSERRAGDRRAGAGTSCINCELPTLESSIDGVRTLIHEWNRKTACGISPRGRSTQGMVAQRQAVIVVSTS